MGMSISSRGDAIPREVFMVLTCDGRDHDKPPTQTFAHGSLNDWLLAASAAGWHIRVGDDAVTLCRQCHRGWTAKPARKRQLDLFGE